MDRIDLRSDTVTRPSAAMRDAMARAEVGDDQYGEDPTVNRLQALVAEMLGKEAALFVPSGTMANQIGLKLLTRPGDEVVVGAEAHIVWHEAGASAANAGVQFMVAGTGGVFDAASFEAAYKPPGHVVFPPTTLVAIENTHNRGGGVVFPQEDIWTGRGCSTHRWRAGGASRNWPHRSTSFRWRCPRGSAVRWGVSSREAARRWRAGCGRGGCWAGRCGNPGCWRRRGCSRSIGGSTGWRRIMPMRG
jgi:hypothetical protein